MADIIPFKGTRYNLRKIKDISKVTAPPYDVISPKEQDELYKKSPYNIIRMLLNKDMPGDNEKHNKYTRSRDFMKLCHKKGILRKDTEPSIYVNLQEFKVGSRIKKRLGFIALLKLEDFGTKTSSVYPHENTFTAPKEDRSRLIRAIEANVGPIFVIFEDKKRTLVRILEDGTMKRPLVTMVDGHGVRDTFWKISEPAKIQSIVKGMKDKKIFIADGHHRYEVGLEFSKLKKLPRYGHILTYFTDLYGDGLVVLPVHRLIGGVSRSLLSLLDKELKRHFVVVRLKHKKNAKDFLSACNQAETRFVFYKDRTFTGLVYKGAKDLDVNVVKRLLIGPLQEKAASRKEHIFIDFTKDFNYAISEVDKKRFSFAVLLNPIKITEIRDAAFKGGRMPQKSTYFYPKVLSGLVINVF